jgi:hypothetical protein
METPRRFRSSSVEDILVSLVADLDVCDLAALVFKEQRSPGRVGDDLCLVRQAVNNLSVFDGLDQVGGSCLPLGTAGACICARHFPLGNSHGYLISLLVNTY